MITLENLADFDMRQTDSAIEYIKAHAKSDKPFFMDVNFMKMHQPTSPNKMFAGKSHLGNYSDSMMELDYNIGRIMDVIRAEAPDTIVIITADNGAWQDAWPDAGTNPFRGEKGSPFEAGWRVPGIMWSPGRIPAGQVLHEMMSHMDVWPTTAAMVGLTPPAKGEIKTTMASRSTSTESTIQPMLRAKPNTLPATNGSISTARTSQALARTSLSIQRRPM